jgi:hypothetical protein
MRHIQNPIATPLDDFDFIVETFYKSTCVAVYKIIRYAIESLL